MPFQHSAQFQKTKLAVFNKESSSSIEQNLDHDDNSSKLLKRTLASAAMVATTAILAYPTLSHALDVSAMSGGAVAAAKVDGLMASLAETGFYQAFSLVFVSSKLVSFLGSMGALFVMTLISVLIGQSFHAVPAGFGEGVLGGLPLDDVAAVIAFAFFGFKTLQEALTMEEGESVMDEELAEAEEDVEELDTTSKETIAYVHGIIFSSRLPLSLYVSNSFPFPSHRPPTCLSLKQ